MRNMRNGSYMVLMAILTLVFVLLCGLVFGTAVLATSKVRIANTSNLVALASLNAYISTQGTTDEKKAAAIAAAQTILQQNPLPYAQDGSLYSTSASNFTVVSSSGDPQGTSGYVEFGLWYPTQPPGELQPCGTAANAYPCFCNTSDPNGSCPGLSSINAAKVVLYTPNTNPILTPMTELLGTSSAEIQGDSIASIVPRCVEFVLDVSDSTVQLTHYPAPNIGNFSYRVIDVNSATNQFEDLDFGPSMDLWNSYYGQPRAFDCAEYGDGCKEWWSGTDPLHPISPNPTPILRARQENDPATDHIASDFWFVRTPIIGIDTGEPQKYLVDSYSFTSGNYPEPLSIFLRAINAGAAEIASQTSSSDVVGVIAFNSNIVSETGLSSSLNLIRQLTNSTNAFPAGQTSQLFTPANQANLGLSPDNLPYTFSGTPIHPNFVDWNWFPNPDVQGSNLIAALHQAYQELNDSNNCPTFARKIIIVASDGVTQCVDTARLATANCADGGTAYPFWTCGSNTYPGTIANPCYPCAGVPVDGVNYNFPRYDCGMREFPANQFVNYAITEYQIEDQTPIAERGVVDVNGAQITEAGVLTLIANAGISITSIQSSEYVDPNFYSAPIPPGQTTPPQPQEAPQLGYDALPYNLTGTFSPFVRWTSYGAAYSSDQGASIAQANTADAAAWSGMWQSHTPFYRANGLMADLSFKTGGIYCPLLTSNDPNNISDSLSWYTGPICNTDSVGSIACDLDQALYCVQQTFGTNPYQLDHGFSPDFTQ